MITFSNEENVLFDFLLLSTISWKKCNIFHKGKFKTDKLSLIEKKMAMKSNYITAYQTYL